MKPDRMKLEMTDRQLCCRDSSVTQGSIASGANVNVKRLELTRG
jgi:hypothetical protein